MALGGGPVGPLDSHDDSKGMVNELRGSNGDQPNHQAFKRVAY